MGTRISILFKLFFFHPQLFHNTAGQFDTEDIELLRYKIAEMRRFEVPFEGLKVSRY